MTQFILNNETISTSVARGMTLLDFIRYQKGLTGTKIGCREGDCGACTILVGELKDGIVSYHSLTSCITPIGNVQGKHVVSIEGLNMNVLSPVQQALVDESGTQCGFCTVGFVVSLTGSCLSEKNPTYDEVISDIDGNICRCTGYKSIERAALRIQQLLLQKDTHNTLKWLVESNFIPKYFESISNRLKLLVSPELPLGNLIVGGGTDLYVQKHLETEEADVYLVSNQPGLKNIERVDGNIYIGAACTVHDMLSSMELNRVFPNLYKHLKLVSSTPIRNIGTVAGNLVNASPIGDLTAFLLALNSTLLLVDADGNQRKILLRNFYKGYKLLDKREDELIAHVEFVAPNNQTFFNFEKVSKRTYLDIASVNTAISIRVNNELIEEAHASAGGVGPTPLYLKRTCAFMIGNKLSEELVASASVILQDEVSPISDVRGTADYKRNLLRNLFYAHFAELFPGFYTKERIA